MGDKSPKANQKKVHQKQNKLQHMAAQKQAAIASKQSAAKNQ
jgi:hypothetical protein